MTDVKPKNLGGTPERLGCPYRLLKLAEDYA
jgi:hypothetical protein